VFAPIDPDGEFLGVLLVSLEPDVVLGDGKFVVLMAVVFLDEGAGELVDEGALAEVF
tara:strand:- start:321267 stop:321437 length:171 start_codon:yes stop_codon:yes gene_type:complete